jgi:carbonic anhydrase
MICLWIKLYLPCVYVLVQVDTSTTDVTIAGGGLVNSDYQLAQFHFHWGASSSSGSEHTIDNKYAPLEVCIKFQTVGYNFDVFLSLTGAYHVQAAVVKL